MRVRAMEITVGTVIISKAGRDKGKFMVVTEVMSKKAVVIDGKERPIERPKLKNIKHIAYTRYKISQYDMAANSRIRKALNLLSSKAQASEEEVQRCQKKI